MIGKCDVCEESREVVVASSALGPVSFRYCAGCLHENAEPYFVFEAAFDMIGSDAAQHVRALKTVGPNGAMTWDEFVSSKASTKDGGEAAK